MNYADAKANWRPPLRRSSSASGISTGSSRSASKTIPSGRGERVKHYRFAVVAAMRKLAVLANALQRYGIERKKCRPTSP